MDPEHSSRRSASFPWISLKWVLNPGRAWSQRSSLWPTGSLSPRVRLACRSVTLVLSDAHGKGFRKRGPQTLRRWGDKSKPARVGAVCLQSKPHGAIIYAVRLRGDVPSPCIYSAAPSHPVCRAERTRRTSLGPSSGPENTCTGQHLGGKEGRNKASLQTSKVPTADSTKIV